MNLPSVVYYPCPLQGSWQVGFALDFHSSFRGADWNRSAIGQLVYRLKYEEDRSVLPLLVEHTLALFAAQPQMREFDVIVPVPPSTPRPFQPLEAARLEIGLCGRLRRQASACADAETAVGAGRPQAEGPKRATLVACYSAPTWPVLLPCRAR